MKLWKRNAVIATVLLFICAGVYLNWSYNQKNEPVDLTETLSAEQVMGEASLQIEPAQEVSAAEQAQDYFAQLRLNRQSSRESAVELLEQTIAYDDESELSTGATQTLNDIVTTALSEAQIESLIIAKGFSDCVTYMADDVVSVAVSCSDAGLSNADVALISDVVTAQTGCSLSQVRVIEVKAS